MIRANAFFEGLEKYWGLKGKEVESEQLDIYWNVNKIEHYAIAINN